MTLEHQPLIYTDPKHPLFKYRTSRNPYESRIDELNNIALKNHGAEQFRGKWRDDIFSDPQKALELEIGPGIGDYLLEQSEVQPDRLFIGLEKKYKQVYKIGKKLEKRGRKNVRIVRGYGERLEYLFSENELDQVTILFPDPWPKKAHHKNRLISERFLSSLFHLVKAEGRLLIRTDHGGYFEHMKEAFSKVESLWEIKAQSGDYEAEKDFGSQEKEAWGTRTLFENIWINEGKNIHAILAHVKK